jgi:indole-3-glycerol phosphate synthase
MNILDAIIEHKRIEILKRKQKRPLGSMEESPHYRRVTHLIDPDRFRKKPGIIAEFKRKSPSKGDINPQADPMEVAGSYQSGGAAAMSILTDRNFFGGSFRDLKAVREAYPDLCLLRKDFIIDPYQLHEASAYGADMVLLIAAVLEKSQVAELTAEAREIGLHILLEVHDGEELGRFHPGIEYVGVNNRDLKTFKVDTSRSMKLIGDLPQGVVPVSESGLGNREEMRMLYRAGYKLFLMGEAFMKEHEPGKAFETFMNEI